MGIEIIFKIAGIGILIAIICQLLKQTGRDDMAMLAACLRARLRDAHLSLQK